LSDQILDYTKILGLQISKVNWLDELSRGRNPLSGKGNYFSIGFWQ
jgi:hypothetical protein